ncbi:MAG: hypothetical protein KKF48_04755 [Nanoarchaeota archaeon]|nr:hypothetical protein [Nanoarchaeota archaeon]MBU1028327.1 hypothetical protein [Nanoarchaeota archaeon]
MNELSLTMTTDELIKLPPEQIKTYAKEQREKCVAKYINYFNKKELFEKSLNGNNNRIISIIDKEKLSEMDKKLKRLEMSLIKVLKSEKEVYKTLHLNSEENK